MFDVEKLILFIVPIFIISIVLAFLSTSYKNNKVDNLANAKSNRTSNYYAIKDLNQEELNNSGLLHKIKTIPMILRKMLILELENLLMFLLIVKI